jgi:S-adenosylmethionine:tRNA ribosyltransferase-isomerase
MSFGEMISGAGKVPLPPYIKREAVTADMERYQTVYSRVEGSVAAPTAGLRFTPSVIQSLKEKEINTLNITLHVGAGTFLPVKTPKISDHTMHSEFFSVTKQFLNDFAKCKTPVIPVGTTALRTLESLYWLGAKLCEQGNLSDDFLYLAQWEAYRINNRLKKSVFEALLEYTDKKGL